MKFSVVVPVFNEEDNISLLVDELAAMAEGREGVEVLLVDDGSRDHTWEQIQQAASRYSFVRGVRSLRNRGQSSAMLLGMHHASGDVIVTMDGDLQNNPADIPTLVEEMGDFDVVCGYRAKRRDSWSRRVGSKIGNAIRNRVTRDGLRDTGCSLKAFRRECIGDLPSLNGAHRFMGAYFKLNGRTIKQIPVDHRPRQFGQSKYTNLKRLPKTIYDLFGFIWYRNRYLRANREVEFSSVRP